MSDTAEVRASAAVIAAMRQNKRGGDVDFTGVSKTLAGKLADAYAESERLNAKCVAAAAVTGGAMAEVDQLRARIAELERERDEEREADYAELCEDCGEGTPIDRREHTDRDDRWYHEEYGSRSGCGASRLRERHYQQQEGRP